MFTGPSFQIKLHLISIVLLSGFQSLDLVGIVNATVYKTEPITTDLTHGKLS